MEKKLITYEIIGHNGTIVIGDSWDKIRYIGYTLRDAKAQYCQSKKLDIKKVEFIKI